ncbi:MAG TPA: STAS/SEC14 domain-containing protein [Polyangiales bacterium]|nr:STAS/SEC14 domain-containing protein [Polyangiales bacterium]
MPLHIDRRGLPLLRLTYIGEYSDDELIRFLSELKAVLALPGSKACLIDLCEATAGSARQRKLQGEWIREHESLLARDFVAAAIVTDSAVIRGTVTAVFWIRPLPMPTHVAPTLAAAEAWLAPYLANLPALKA